MNRRLLVLVVVAVAVVGLVPNRASAHALRVVVKLPPDATIVEAGYDDDTPAEKAKVTITNGTGQIVAEGKTDEKGVYKFARLSRGKYKVVVEAVGHRDAVEFEVAGTGFEEFTGWRPDQTTGLAIGVTGLLGVSGAYWLWRRK